MLYPLRRYGVSVHALTKDHRRLKINTPYPEDSIRRIQDTFGLNSLLDIANGLLFVLTSTVTGIIPISNIRSDSVGMLDKWTISVKIAIKRMTKVIKGEFEKIKVEDVSLTCDTSLEIFNMEVSRLSGMDNDLFTHKVEVANIPYNSVMDDDLEDETDDDMGYDPSDVAFIEWLRSKNSNYKMMDQYTMKALWILFDQKRC
ncbi:hypothetical protein Tco_0920541 [Tanacetum coccineum]